MANTLYDVLEVTPHAQLAVIKASYRALAQKYHPDKNSGDKSSEERFKEIQYAYEVLSDPDRRKEYDATLATKDHAQPEAEARTRKAAEEQTRKNPKAPINSTPGVERQSSPLLWVMAILVFLITLSLYFSGQKESGHKETDPGISLINEGWRYFIGSTGVVNEKKAFDITLSGVNSLSPEAHKNIIGVGLNNLSVFYFCAQDPRIRDYQRGILLDESRDITSDQYSPDNFVWAVFVQMQKVNDPVAFFRTLKEKWPTHPVNKYVDSLGGKPPISADQAYLVLKDFAEKGDPHAAMRVGYRYECYDRSPDINQAIYWYRRAR